MTTLPKLSIASVAAGLVFSVGCLSLASSTTSRPTMVFQEAFQKPKWTLFEARNGQKFAKFETKANASTPINITAAELTIFHRSGQHDSNTKNCIAWARVEGSLSGPRAVTNSNEAGQVVRLIERTDGRTTASESVGNLRPSDRGVYRFRGGPWLARPNPRMVSILSETPCSN